LPLDSNYNVLLISSQALIDNGVIDQNVDPKVVQPVIKLVQDSWLQGVLGTPMFVYLQDGIANNTLLSTDIELLQWYVEPVMIWYVTYELSLFNSYKIKIKGLERMSGENSQAASLTEIQSYRDKTKETAEMYAQRLLRYMEAYPTLFPAFWNTAFTIADIQPNRRSAYRSSMYLGHDDNPYDRRYRGAYEGFGMWFFENY